MDIKKFFSKIFNYNNSNSALELKDIPEDSGEPQKDIGSTESSKEVAIKKTTPSPQRQLEFIQNTMNDLISQLKGINENLSIQTEQSSKLINNLKDLPDIVKSLPNAVQTQTQTTENLIEQLKLQSKQNIEFLTVIEKIPSETGKQTDVLEKISSQLNASAETDVQFAESFNNFKGSLENLDKTTQDQTQTISQMSKTFAASDRYLKYLISVQSRRFMWAFIISIGVSAFCIIVLLIIIAFLVA
jgi:uncharacterized protein YoxC